MEQFFKWHLTLMQFLSLKIWICFQNWYSLDENSLWTFGHWPFLSNQTFSMEQFFGRHFITFGCFLGYTKSLIFILQWFCHHFSNFIVGLFQNIMIVYYLVENINQVSIFYVSRRCWYIWGQFDAKLCGYTKIYFFFTKQSDFMVFG